MAQTLLLCRSTVGSSPGDDVARPSSPGFGRRPPVARWGVSGPRIHAYGETRGPNASTPVDSGDVVEGFKGCAAWRTSRCASRRGIVCPRRVSASPSQGSVVGTHLEVVVRGTKRGIGHRRDLNTSLRLVSGRFMLIARKGSASSRIS